MEKTLTTIPVVSLSLSLSLCISLCFSAAQYFITMHGPIFHPPLLLYGSLCSIDLWLWSGTRSRTRRGTSHDPGGCDAVLQATGDLDGRQALRLRDRHLERGLHLRRTAQQTDSVPSQHASEAGRFMSLGIFVVFTLSVVVACTHHSDAVPDS